MGWSNGTYSRVHDWTADAASDIDIEASRMDQEADSTEAGINNCLTKDGQNTPTADLPMGGNKHTGVGEGSARNHYAAIGQLQDGDIHIAGSVAGTDTITGTMAPAITAYTNGMRVIFLPANDNTGAATLNLNSVGAQSITKNGTTALAAGDLVDGVWADVIYDLANTNWILLNPQTAFAEAATTITAGSGLTGGGDLSTDRTINVGAGTGISVAADSVSTDDSAIVHDNLSGFVADEHVAHSGVSITAGAGLTGGGSIASTRTINVGAGTGITVNANDVATDDSAIVHDNLSGFVANEHINHSSVTLTAGDGLSGGGTIAANRSFAVDSTVIRTTGNQTIGGTKTFSTRPVSSSAGGFLSHANSSNASASVIITDTTPSDTSGMSAGDIKLVY